MTSREIVKACIEFRDPPRCAWDFKVMPINGRVWDDSDFACLGPTTPAEYMVPDDQLEWVTEWGDKRSRINTLMGEAIEFPLKDWSDLDRYEMPDLASPDRNAHLKSETEQYHLAGKYVYGWIPGLMLTPIDLRGIENWFMDNACEQENLSRLLDGIVDLRKRMIDCYCAAGMDGVISWDDMGTNNSGFISPETFRELYLAPYRETIGYLHERDMHFLHHCCGNVKEYMDMIVEAGCDVIQLDQPELMGIDWLSERYAGRICFWNCVDIQKTMGKGNIGAVEAEARKQVEKFTVHGGFMVKAYYQSPEIGISEAEFEAQYRAFKKYGVYHQ